MDSDCKVIPCSEIRPHSWLRNASSRPVAARAVADLAGGGHLDDTNAASSAWDV